LEKKNTVLKTTKPPEGGFLNQANLDDCHLEIFFACAALRTRPVHWYVLPQCARSNTLIRQACLFIVDPATNQTHISFKFHDLFFLFFVFY